MGGQWGGRVRRFIGVPFARRAGAQRSRGGELGLGGRAPTSCRHVNGKAGSADVLVGMRMEKLTWGAGTSSRCPRILRATGTSPAPGADGDVSAPGRRGRQRSRNYEKQKPSVFSLLRCASVVCGVALKEMLGGGADL